MRTGPTQFNGSSAPFAGRAGNGQSSVLSLSSDLALRGAKWARRSAAGSRTFCRLVYNRAVSPAHKAGLAEATGPPNAPSQWTTPHGCATRRGAAGLWP